MFIKKSIPRNDSNEVEKLKYSSDSDDNWDSDTINSILNSDQEQTISKKGNKQI